LKIFEQTLIEKFQANPDFEKSNAITIAIEMMSRIDHDPVFKSQSRIDFPKKTNPDFPKKHRPLTPPAAAARSP